MDFQFKSYGVKKQYAHCELFFHILLGPTEDSNYLKHNWSVELCLMLQPACKTRTPTRMRRVMCTILRIYTVAVCRLIVTMQFICLPAPENSSEGFAL